MRSESQDGQSVVIFVGRLPVLRVPLRRKDPGRTRVSLLHPVSHPEEHLPSQFADECTRKGSI